MCVDVLQKIPTGCKTIDRFLDEGILQKTISLIYGEAETGKTTLAIQCAVNCSKQGYKVLFVDSDRTFSTRRLSQIASENFKEIAERIILMKPSDFREQTLVVDQLTDFVAKNFGLVVFDTITSLYRAKVSESPEKTFSLNRELNRQMALLAQTARTQKIAVLITSQVRSAFNNHHMITEPVATRVLKFWAETIISMKPTENPQVIKATLEKSPIKDKKAQPLTCHLKIEKTGIHEYIIP